MLIYKHMVYLIYMKKKRGSIFKNIFYFFLISVYIHFLYILNGNKIDIPPSKKNYYTYV